MSVDNIANSFMVSCQLSRCIGKYSSYIALFNEQLKETVADPRIEFGMGTRRARGGRAYNGDPGADPLVRGERGEAP